ncbi:MAG: sll0787 family AIR synthase-like protein [Planctomycetota bacterium]
MTSLEALAEQLRRRSGIQSKRDIGRTVGTCFDRHNNTPQVGDDCAAIPDGDGYLLFAIEGLIQDFVEQDPWFAGYSAVMVNLSDVAAMGGRPIAVADALWARDTERFAKVWAGMQAASERYGVPIVGGHTNVHSQCDQLAVSVLGRARRLLTSFDAQAGDDLLAAVDLRGAYREPNDFWNASSETPDPQRLRDDLELLPWLAEQQLAHAAKDISMAGLVGTALMLAECSGVGMSLRLDEIPRPDGVPLERWLNSFPSYGYILSVSPVHTDCVVDRFGHRGLACAKIGRVEPERSVDLHLHDQTTCFWDLEAEPLMNFSLPQPATATH